MILKTNPLGIFLSVIIASVSLVLLSCGGGGAAVDIASWQPEPGISRLSATHDNFERELLVQLPEGYDPGSSYPLVLGFHGAGRTCEDWPDWLDDVARNHDFIGIYPQGMLRSWESTLRGRRVDDIAFTSWLIAWADSTLAVDSSRRYAAGFSRGALFVSRLACRIRGLAGIAALAGTFFQNPKIEPVAPPRRIFIAHGTYDKVIPYNGGMAEHGEFFEPVESVARMWGRALGCDQRPSVSPVSDIVTTIEYGPCRGAGAVRLLKVQSGHHVYEYVDGLFPMIWDFWEAGR